MVSTDAVRFGEALTVRHAEEVLLVLESRSGPLIVDLSACKQIDVGAGWRLGLALRRFSGALTVHVPGVRPTAPFSGDWFRLFTRSGLGWVFARHAAEVFAGSESITVALRDYYGQRSITASANHLAMVGLETGLAVDVNDADRFQAQVFSRLRLVAPDLLDEQQSVQPLLRLCFEAIQNVYDHATRKPLTPGTPFVGLFSVARYETASAPPNVVGGYREYLDRLPKVSAAFSPRPRAFVELVVVDDGVGMAARHAQDFGVYEGPVADEDRCLVSALSDGGSIKLIAADCPVRGDPGFGFAYVQQSLKALWGFAQLRTGRRLVVFDSTLAETDHFELVDKVLGYLPGTALHVTIPIRENQPSLLDR